MNDINEGRVIKINIANEKAWKEPPVVTEPTFDQKASMRIAAWIVMLFAGVYLFCFAFGFFMIFSQDASFDGGLEFVKLMLSSILPLVTLAVGYYLGDKNNTT